MKYRSPNKYTTNLSKLITKFAVSAGVVGTFVISGQAAQAINEFSEDRVNPPSLIQPDLLKTILGRYQQSSQEENSLDPVLISQSLPSQNFNSLEKSEVAKVPKKISTLANTLSPEKDRSTTTIVLQSNLDINVTKAIPELPTLEIAQNNLLKKLPKQIHTVRGGETISSIARKYKVSDGELIQLNNLANPNRIHVDDKLILPSNDYSDNTVVNSNPVVDSSVELKSAPNTDLDPYISRLREDVVKLRTKYKTQVTDNSTASSPILKELTYTSESQELVASTSETISTPKNQLSSKGSLSIAPMDSEYDDLLELSSLNYVTPDLPPLSAPEKYLPNTSFNGYIWPAQGTFTSGYGWRWGRMHKGIDIAAPIGTPIVAAASGEVISAGWNSGGYGNLVKLRHQDGSVTLYAHNNRIYVRKGQRIKQGQQIAEMGSTGFSTGPHLHFELRLNGRVSVNPIAYLSKNSK